MQKNKTTHFAMATVAALLIGGCASRQVSERVTDKSTDNDNDMGQCLGVNSCKGSGSCATANNHCATQNSCKGKGWIPLEKSDCESRSGQFMGLQRN